MFVNATCDFRWLIFCQRLKVACVSEDDRMVVLVPTADASASIQSGKKPTVPLVVLPL